MKSAKRPDAKAEATECILRLGKANNVIVWNEEMKSTVGALYGATANFLQTNERYVPPLPREEDYLPVFPPTPEGGVAPAALSTALIAKLREGAFEGRRKAVAQQRADEQKIWSIMWTKMSPASQSKIQEMDNFEQACLDRDCVQLWGFVRRTHLTYIYGEGDRMTQINVQEAENRYNALRQMDKELVSSFKLRFDNEVKSCNGAGVPAVADAKRALDFLYKLDAKRFKKMLASMRNNALCMTENAYPATLSAAYRIASGWVNDDYDRGFNGPEGHSAFVADSNNPATSTNPTTGKSKTKKSEKKHTTKTCFVCGVAGHYARDCSQKKGGDTALVAQQSIDEADEEELFYDEVGEAAYVVGAEVALFTREDVLLDSQASVNVFSNGALLHDIGAAKRAITLKGVEQGTRGVSIRHEGDFETLGKVYFSEKTTANILSYAVMIDSGNSISYEQASDSFILKPKDSAEKFIFSRKPVTGSEGRFYCCNMRDRRTSIERAFIETSTENMKRYTKREVESARNARELLGRMGYPTTESAVRIIRSGNNFETTAHDFRVAEAIWGPDIASLKGRTVKRQTTASDVTVGPTLLQIEQVLAIDIMFVEGIPSLVGVATPLDLTLAVSLTSYDTSRPSRCATVIKKGLAEIISTLASRNFLVKVIMSDGEGGVGSVAKELKMMGIEVDVSGAGGHVSRIERRIRTIKERVRAHIAYKLPYALNSLGIAMLVLFCVSRYNFQMSELRDDGASPRELFTGRAVSGELDFRVGFGEFCQCTVPNTDNSMSGRTEDCISVLPTGNRSGSVKMMSIASGRIVTRDQFRIVPMTPYIISELNKLAEKEGRAKSSAGYWGQEVGSGGVGTLPSFAPATSGESDDPIQGMNPTPPDYAETMPPEPTPADLGDTGERNGYPDTEEREMLEAREEAGGEEPVEVEPVATPVRRTMMDMFRRGGVEMALSTSALDSIEEKIGGDLSDYAMNITVKQALKTRGEEAEKVIMKELSQMVDKRVWRPVHVHRLSAQDRGRIIRSQMFLKEKYLPTGQFEKLKARLVAGGNEQDKGLYEDLSSPTVSTSAVLTVLAVAAHENRRIAVVDITGAYLNADMGTDIAVHMRLDPLISGLMMKLCNDYARFADERGCIVVRLQKALYGCVESAALWHDNLSGTMKELGYEKNRHEGCVFNKRSKEGIQCTVALHVDDLLITSASGQLIDELCEGLRLNYGAVTRSDGPVVNYLGMTFDVGVKGEARVTMKGYIQDALDASGTEGLAASPAIDELFDVRDTANVSEEDRVRFHSMVAKLLYLAKRTKPECLTAVSFLATRVTRCTADDIGKLARLVRYIRRTKDRGVVLRPGLLGIRVRVFADAAFGVHTDFRSHTGSCVVIGDTGAVHCRSSKQTSVTKSSTEAELMAVSDSANQGLYLRHFLKDQGHDTGPVTIYQDNTSTIALLTRGRPGAERSRHIDIRHFWLHDKVKDKEAIIVHLGTKEMYANVLTKPLQGKQFAYERDCLTGWEVGK